MARSTGYFILTFLFTVFRVALAGSAFRLHRYDDILVVTISLVIASTFGFLAL